MKKKTKVIIAALVVLLLVTCVTVVFLMKGKKSAGTLAANTDTEDLQDKELNDKQAANEIKTTSEETTEASAKEKEKADKQDKTTEASVTTEKPGTTEASVQGLPTASTTTEKPRTTEETPATTEKPHTTEAPAPAHVHSWKTINHPAETHKEKQLVCKAYDEDVYEYHMTCNACGAYLDPPMSADEREAHMYNCSSGYTDGTIKVGTVHHDAEYETVTVVDKEAWTETVCETCGERKQGLQQGKDTRKKIMDDKLYMVLVLGG